jgi:hypothetical protein
MSNNSLFSKTSKGQVELDTRSGALNMRQRRVLILIDGERNPEALQRRSLCDAIDTMLTSLLDKGMIEIKKPPPPKPASKKLQEKPKPVVSKPKSRPMSYLC